MLHLPLTVVACGVVLAPQALPGHRVTVISMPVALAGLATWKAPVAGQTSVALPSVHALETGALASVRVAEGTDGALQMAVTSCRDSTQDTPSETHQIGCAPFMSTLVFPAESPWAPMIGSQVVRCLWKLPLHSPPTHGPDHGNTYSAPHAPTFASTRSKAKGSRRTPVAGSSNHIGPALALASVGVTHRTQGALRVTLTSCRGGDTRTHDMRACHPSLSQSSVPQSLFLYYCALSAFWFRTKAALCWGWSACVWTGTELADQSRFPRQEVLSPCLPSSNIPNIKPKPRTSGSQPDLSQRKTCIFLDKLYLQSLP